MTQPSNVKLVVATALVIGAIVMVTWWKSAQRDTDAMSAASTEPPTAGLAPAATDGMSATPAKRDVWSDGAVPRIPASANDRRSVLGNPEQRARAQEEYARLVGDLERTHTQQAVDPTWKAPTEATLSKIAEDDALLSSGIAPEAVRADCRSSTCRVSADFGSPADAQDWAVLFTAMTGKDFRKVRYVTVPQPSGGVEVRIYGNRR